MHTITLQDRMRIYYSDHSKGMKYKELPTWDELRQTDRVVISDFRLLAMCPSHPVRVRVRVRLPQPSQIGRLGTRICGERRARSFISVGYLAELLGDRLGVAVPPHLLRSVMFRSPLEFGVLNLLFIFRVRQRCHRQRPR